MNDLEIQKLAGDSIVPIAFTAATLPVEERILYWGKIATMLITTGYIIAGEIKKDGNFDHAAATKWLGDITAVAKNDTKFILEHPEIR